MKTVEKPVEKGKYGIQRHVMYLRKHVQLYGVKLLALPEWKTPLSHVINKTQKCLVAQPKWKMIIKQLCDKSEDLRFPNK